MFTSGPFRRDLLALLLIPFALCGGCTTIRGTIPARCFPDASQSPRGSRQPIDYSLLRQTPPEVYQLGPGDILGIFIEGVLGKIDDVPPVYYPTYQTQGHERPPALGYPIPVREDGTISLPLVEPLEVAGLSLAQAEEAVHRAYTTPKPFFAPGRDRVIVTLIEPRKYNVIVVREDGVDKEGRPLEYAQYQFSPRGSMLEAAKTGITQSVELKAYENDVLHALALSGGLPGVAAKAQVKILHGAFKNARERDQYLRTLQDPAQRAVVAATNQRTLTIPLRIGPGEPVPHITRDDILLESGDIVYIESREQEVFYTGGILQGGEFPIPRDRDLDVLSATAWAGGSIAATAGGYGGPGGRGNAAGIFPPTDLIVLRNVEGRQVAIKVDLKRAMTDPSERILVQPNDFLILQYKPQEVILNVILNNLNVSLSLDNLFKG
jgi:protein involved in polysaccharide export with SLBB domain